MSENKKMFRVTLDGSKCLSYSMNGRKYLPTKGTLVPEDKLAPFKSAAVFLFTPIVSKEKAPVTEPSLSNVSDEKDGKPISSKDLPKKDDGKGATNK